MLEHKPVAKLKADKTMTELFKEYLPKSVIPNTPRYGSIDYFGWLMRGGIRIQTRNKNRTVYIGEGEQGRVSLWVNDVGEHGPYSS